MDEDKANALLAQEYLQLQKTVEDFDSRSLTIKAWSVTFSLAAIGIAFKEKTPVLLLVAAGSAWAFWFVDAVWKLHQRAFYPRLREIEEHFAGRKPTPPFQISRSWRASSTFAHSGLLQRLGLSLLPGVALPHALVIGAGLILYLAPGLRPG